MSLKDNPPKELPPEIKKVVDEAKASGHSVFSLKISGTPYYYRSINRKEFQDLQEQLIENTDALRTKVDAMKANLDPKDPKNKDIDIMVEKETIKIRDTGEERLVHKGLLFPILGANTPAGVLSTLADRIMQASGYGVEEDPEQL